MNKMEMMQEMMKRIQADESLAIAEWQGTYDFENGALVDSSLVNLNEIEIAGSPEMPAGQMTAVEMLIASMANCYATTLHKNAFTNKLALPQVRIQVTGKFDLRPFFGLNDDDPGIMEPTLVVRGARTDEAAFKEIAEASVIGSPVLRSLREPVSFTIEV